MKPGDTLDATECILKRSGFQISKRCVARPSCFDFVARRKEQTVFLKISADVGNVTARDSCELRMISGCFSAVPFFISDRTRRKPLEDDTVYMRYSIFSITPETLEDIVFREINPLIEAGPGGYYVNIDGNTVKERRQKLGLSIGKLAEMIGISRRTLYGYERGMAKASVLTAYNLEWVLGVPVVQPFNVFQSYSSKGFFSTAKQIVIKNRCLHMVLKGLTKLNVRVTPTRRAPFDFIVNFTGEGLNIVGGVADERDQNIEKRTEEIISISRVIDAHSVFITDGEQIPANNIPLIHHEDLSKIECSKDLISRL